MTITHPLLTIGLFWLIILLALAGAAWWILRASAAGEVQEGDRADLEVYVDQVSEIDRDLAQGRIAETAADAAKLEIGRRLVKARDRVLTRGPRANRLTLAGVAAGVTLLAGALYFVSGNPGQRDLPFSARERELLSRDPATLTQDEILVLLQERARLNPEDPVPHALMGQVLVGAGRDQDALRAFQAVLRRAPNDAEAISEAAGILTRLNDGKIGDDAQQAFDAALKIDDKSPTARFYLGLADWHAGRKDAAMTAWSAAFDKLADKPNSQMLLAARAAQVMSELDRGPDASQTGQGPMQNQSPEDQAAFIATMVDARRARLAANPGDVALRLSVVRVLVVTGQNDLARQTLLQGIQRGTPRPFEVALYAVAARSLEAPALPASKATPSVTKR
jgi:cytochrome c-type biogenesis protein CcmH